MIPILNKVQVGYTTAFFHTSVGQDSP